MKQKELMSKLRRLYVAQEFSWDSVMIPDNQTKIQARYRFRELGLLQDGNNVALRGIGGQFGEESPRALAELKIEPQAVELLVQGDTQAARSLLGEIEEMLASWTPGKSELPLKPLVDSFETFLVCELDFDRRRLFSAGYLAFLEAATRAIESTYPTANIAVQPSEIRGSVIFMPKVPEYRFSNKVLAIEPRKGIEAGQQLYWTTSPLPNDKHFALVEELERSLRKERVH